MQLPQEGGSTECATIEDKKKTVSMLNEFLDVFEEISRLSPDIVMEFSMDIIPGATPSLKNRTGWHQKNWQY